MVNDGSTVQDQDSTMTDVSADSDEPILYSSTNNEMNPINISSDSDDENILWYTLKDCVEPKIGMATRRPHLKMKNKEQKAAYKVKYGHEGDSLRQMEQSTKISKKSKVTKVNYCPVPDQLAPV